MASQMNPPAVNGGTALDFPASPRFFPGQLLTDRDLNDLVAWVRSRLGLERLREGWGVVCGLDVSVSPGRPWEVVVGPGQGVDVSSADGGKVRSMSSSAKLPPIGVKKWAPERVKARLARFNQ